MKVRGKRRKLKRIQAARLARWELAMLMLGEQMTGMGMAFSITSQAMNQFVEANRMQASRDRGSDWSKP